MGRRSGGGHHHHHHDHHDDHDDHGDQEDRPNQQYVTGDTNWESYELPQLVSMVNDKVDLDALHELAYDWRQAGDDMVDAAYDLGKALDDLMEFWTGPAAEQARTDVALNAQWVSDLGSTAYRIGTPVEQAAGALKAAQDQMPPLETTPAIVRGSAPHGALEAGSAGGPLGEAIGGVAEGTESAAAAAEEEARRKRQAVETMQRFEAAAISIDQAIPQFQGRGTELRSERPGHRTPPPEPVNTIINLTSNTTVSWQELTGQRGHTSAQGVPEHSGAGGGGGGGGFGGGHVPIAAGLTGGGLSGGGPAGGGFGGSGGGRVGNTGSGAGAAPIVERMPGGLAASAVPVDADGHHGMAGGGAAPMGGMGAGAGGGSTSDHRRRFPFEADDPFILEQKASPPVIGL
jgi:hypothetical protein